jgi:hypothetical protein
MTILEKYRDNIEAMISAIVAQMMPLTMKSIAPFHKFLTHREYEHHVAEIQNTNQRSFWRFHGPILIA